MKKEVSAPLVGMRYRPPALTVLQCLGMDQPLELRREPENPHDENAIAVYVPKDWEVPDDVTESCDVEGIKIDPDNLMLGYIARNVAETWAPVLDQALLANEPLPPSRLTFTSTGAPQVTLEIEDETALERVEDSDETNWGDN